MPIKSKSQQRLMFAAAQDKQVAEDVGISQNVAREYIKETPKERFSKLKEKVKGKKK